MADTVRSLAALQALLSDNTAGDISAQDVRDFLVSAYQVPGVVPGGRLTTESGVPVSTSDRTSQGTIYYTPYLHNRIGLYDGTSWTLFTFTERSLALSGLTSGLNYDVFLYDNAGTLTLELTAWTNDTTRATALTTQDGVYVKTGATTRRYLGTIRTTGTTTTEDSASKRLVWNQYNRVERQGRRQVSSNHTYASSARRYWNNDSASRLEIVVGDPLGTTVRVGLNGGVIANVSGQYATISVGLDTSTGTKLFEVFSSVAQEMLPGGTDSVQVPVGWHYLSCMEEQNSGTGNFVSFWLTAGWWL